MSNPREDPHSVASEGMGDERSLLDITVENDCGSIKVKFGDVTHINFRYNRFLGFQTWRHSDNHFCIEIMLAGGKIKTEYDNRDKWETIIAGLDCAVAQ